uniref:Transmembrane protein n=1 Tax=Pithovirus LCPAC401 TaxID=2506595 RepID=A0A481ZDE2_9VIRU|nr:MAG: hypothetical protein LCPAC401_03290 [Pithovirus LCPAC401]
MYVLAILDVFVLFMMFVLPEKFVPIVGGAHLAIIINFVNEFYPFEYIGLVTLVLATPFALLIMISPIVISFPYRNVNHTRNI